MDLKRLVSAKMEILVGIVAVAAIVGAAFNAFYPSEDGVGAAAMGSLADIERQYGVERLDPSSPTPLAEQALREVKKTDPLGKYEGVNYRLTSGNQLKRGWIVQTPDVWGARASSVVSYPLDC